MAYYYKGQEILTPYNIFDNRTVFQNQSLNLQRTTTFLPGQRFDLNFLVKPSHDPSQIMLAHISGFHKVDTMIMPQALGMEEKRTFKGSVVAASNAVAGADVVSIVATSGDGVGNIIPAGYFVTFAGHPKLYMVVEDVELNDTTNKSLKIYPRLNSDVAASENVNLGDDVQYTYERDIKTARGVSFNNGVLTNPGTINLIEKI